MYAGRNVFACDLLVYYICSNPVCNRLYTYVHVAHKAQHIAMHAMEMITFNTCIKFQQRSDNESTANSSKVVFIDPRYSYIYGCMNL